MATDPARQEPYEEEGIGGESIGARRSGGGSTSTNWSEQPTYTTAVARSSLGGGIVAGLLVIILFAVPVAWGVGWLAAFTQRLGLRLDDAALWAIYIAFAVFFALIAWLAWKTFTRSFTDAGQYRQ